MTRREQANCLNKDKDVRRFLRKNVFCSHNKPKQPPLWWYPSCSSMEVATWNTHVKLWDWCPQAKGVPTGYPSTSTSALHQVVFFRGNFSFITVRMLHHNKNPPSTASSQIYNPKCNTDTITSQNLGTKFCLSALMVSDTDCTSEVLYTGNNHLSLLAIATLQ